MPTGRTRGYGTPIDSDLGARTPTVKDGKEETTRKGLHWFMINPYVQFGGGGVLPFLFVVTTRTGSSPGTKRV